MYKLKFHRKIDKDLSKQTIEFRKQIKNIHLPRLIENPLSYPALKGGLKGIRKYSFKFKNSDYRIAYSVEQDEVVVYIIMVGSRENFYKKLKTR